MDDQLDVVDVDGEHMLRVEAEEAIKDISYAVDSVQISSVLPNTRNNVYLNLKTKENQTYCVQLSVQGFRVSLLAVLWNVPGYIDTCMFCHCLAV